MTSPTPDARHAAPGPEGWRARLNRFTRTPRGVLVLLVAIVLLAVLVPLASGWVGGATVGDVEDDENPHTTVLIVP